MKRFRSKNKEEKLKPAVDQPIAEEAPIAETTEVDSIEDFIELKRLQNRILEKLIDQISQTENPEKTNNKKNN